MTRINDCSLRVELKEQRLERKMGIFDWFANQKKKQEKFKEIVQIKKFENYSDFITEPEEISDNYKTFSEALEHGFDEEIPRRLWRIMNKVKDREDLYIIRFKNKAPIALEQQLKNKKSIPFMLIKNPKVRTVRKEGKEMPCIHPEKADDPFNPYDKELREFIRKFSEKSPKLYDSGRVFKSELLLIKPDEIVVYAKA